MTKTLKLFLISLAISVPIWWGTNLFQKGFENFLFAQIIPESNQSFTAELVSALTDSPQKELNIQAEATLSVIAEDGQQGWSIMYQHNQKEILPIASLTKLMTAYVVLENYDLSQPVTISQTAVGQEEDLGQLKAGEILTIKNILYIMLIESSNDAAYALAEVIGVNNFVDIMNWEVKNLGLRNTQFVNPTGLTGENNSQNYSTAQDLAILTKKLLDNPILWEILRKPEYALRFPDGKLHHILKNTNTLLTEESRWKDKIYGGKTGWSQEAKGCLLLVIKDGNEYLINIILGADDRFGEMKNLINNEL